MSRIKVEKFVSDLSGEEIEEGSAVEVTAKMPDGGTQRLDLSRSEYASLGWDGKGSTQKRRGRKPKSI